jgi:two-component system, cell cycle sensor histidine kinase and response regulator CckA
VRDRRLNSAETIALLEATLEASQDGILVADLNRQVVYCNGQYLRMFGLTRELVARGVDAIVAAMLPQIENADYIVERSQAVWSEPELEVVDVVRFKDGRVFERFVVPHRLGGTIVGRVASFRDISRFARTEQALEQHRAFLEKAQEVGHIGSWVAELDGSDRLGWSVEAHRIFGVALGSFEGTSESFFARVHPADVEAVRAASAGALADERPYDIEHRIIRSDGGVRWVNERADIVRDQAGQPLRMIGAVQDITDRRLLEDQLRQSQKMEAIGRLAGGIAHDLNNALTAIAGYSELALAEIPSDHIARADVEEIRRATERAGSVTRQLLAFSRKELLEPRLFNLNDTIGALGRLLARLLGADIEVRTELAADLPPILGDPGQVEQAVINLAVNARDAMSGRGHLMLSTALETLDEAAARANAPMPPGTYIVLRVTDDGHGMSAETQARIFEPFFTTKETGKGTGLGLSMVYSTLKQIGGFIFVTSEKGRGTTFRLYFKPSAALAPAKAATIGPATARGAETVLVVEDESSVRNLVASSLRTEGYRLLLASSAEEALELADSFAEPIHLLLTDAIMPGKSGIELANLLVKKREALRVIIMSGYTEETLTGLKSHAELLQKPFLPKDLRLRVRAALDQRTEHSR